MTDLDYAQAHVRQLATRVKQLEQEIEHKDEVHLHELKTLRDQLTNIIKNYKLD